MHKGINKTKLALAEEEIGWYLEEFEKHVEEEVLMIGNIGLGEVQVCNILLSSSLLEFQSLQEIFKCVIVALNCCKRALDSLSNLEDSVEEIYC